MAFGAGSVRRLITAVLAALMVSAAVARADGPAPGPGPDEISKAIRKAGDAVKKGEYADAERLYKRALEAAPGSLAAARGLGWTYLKTRRYVEAGTVAESILRAAPDDARALSISGMALMRSGLLREAADVFVKAANKDPNESLAVAGLAEILFFTGNFADSLRFAERAVRLSDNEPDFLFLLGQVAARQEQFEEAAEVYELFLRTAPKVDSERRDRIKALIDLCRALVGVRLYSRSGSDSVALPITFTSGSVPVVSVTLNGEGPFRFAIDTGSGFTVISDAAAARLNIRPVARGGTSQGVGGEGKFPIVYGLIRSLGLGEMRIDNVPAYIRRFHQDAADAVDGYVGLSILARFMAAIDYGNRRFELKPLESPAVEPGPGDVALAYQVTAGSMLTVPTDIETGGLLNFVVDTGASTSVVSTQAFNQFGLGSKLDTHTTARVVGAAGVTEGVPTVVFGSLSVAGMEAGRTLRREAVHALVLDLSAINETAGFQVAGIIGGNVLRDYRVELDTARGRLVLRPNRSQD